ncbi:MAG: hypothetical protein M1142_06260 [Patescibacteria group bacterium]|nr:hypothetical protein [Patescibacteria group bacterium]
MTDKIYLLLIFLFDGLIWLKSSIGKFQSGNFADSLGGTLAKFASNNPYPWYKSFLQNVAIPNSKIFGLFTQWGEFFSAISIILASIFLLLGTKNKVVLVLLFLGLLGGMFLNAIFWLASGWTSASTDSLNLLMFVIQTIGLAYVLNLLKNRSL